MKTGEFKRRSRDNEARELRLTVYAVNFTHDIQRTDLWIQGARRSVGDNNVASRVVFNSLQSLLPFKKRYSGNEDKLLKRCNWRIYLIVTICKQTSRFILHAAVSFFPIFFYIVQVITLQHVNRFRFFNRLAVVFLVYN